MNLVVSTIHAKIQAQIVGLGVDYLCLHLIRYEIDSQQLIVKQVENFMSPENISAVWRINQAGKAIEWFIEKLKDSEIYKLMKLE